MRFRGIHIEGFGLYCDARVTDLPRLGVFTGANESGKSTLLEFLRFVLFGDRPGSAGAAVYPALAGGRRGGRLTLESALGERLDLERLGAGRTAIATLRDGAGQDLGEPETALAGLLGGLDRGAFERIFAIGAAELEGLGLLDDRDLVRRLAAATAGTPALPAALSRLDREIGALLKGDRARSPRVNAAFLALDDALARRRARGAEEELFARTRATLDERQGDAEALVSALEDERRRLEDAARAQPLFDQAARLADRLAAPELQAPPSLRWPRAALAGSVLVALGLALVVDRPALPVLAALFVGVAAAVLGRFVHRRGVLRVAERRAPLEADLEAVHRELEAKAGTTVAAVFSARLAEHRVRLRGLEERERSLLREIGRLEREADSLGRGAELEAALADGAAARTESTAASGSGPGGPCAASSWSGLGCATRPSGVRGWWPPRRSSWPCCSGSTPARWSSWGIAVSPCATPAAGCAPRANGRAGWPTRSTSRFASASHGSSSVSAARGRRWCSTMCTCASIRLAAGASPAASRPLPASARCWCSRASRSFAQDLEAETGPGDDVGYFVIEGGRIERTG